MLYYYVKHNNKMFRSSLLKHIIRPVNMVKRTSTVMNYNFPNKKPSNDKDKMIEKFIISVLLGGGIGGSGYFAQKTYRETYILSFRECVGYTTFMTFYGFILGGSATFLLPIFIPITIVVGTIRYFDHTPKIDYDRGFMDYTLHTRKDT